MHEAYFQTYFDAHGFLGPWPKAFAIITAFETTGEVWTPERNSDADRQLQGELDAWSVWHRRATGFSPSSGHSEPGWAAELPFEDACDLGLKFLQDAIYYVEDDRLFVSYCDKRRQRMPVDVFQNRIRNMQSPL